MNLEFKFSNLEQLRELYNPEVVAKAAYFTVEQLNSRAATEVSKAVRVRWNVTASGVKSALKPRLKMQDGIPVGYLIYTGKRISLRHFATSARPKIKTKRGVRYGARVKDRRDQRARLVPGGFFGTAKDSGSGQIFHRIGKSRLKIKKLTGPSIAQMVRSDVSLKAINDLMQSEADTKFAHNLDHFLQKQTGIR